MIDMTDMTDYVEDEEEEYASVGETELDSFTSDDDNEDEYNENTTSESIENVESAMPLRTVYENEVQQTNRLRINHRDDNDDKLADFSKGTLQHFYALGYIAGDGFHYATGELLGIACESVMFLELIGIVQMLGVTNPTFAIQNNIACETADVNHLKKGHVRSTKLIWECRNPEVDKKYRDYGLPSSKILRTDPVKIKQLFPDNIRMVMFFFGLLSSDGCVVTHIRYTDGTRALRWLSIKLTDKLLLQELMERINSFMTLQYPDVKPVVTISMKSRKKEHWMDQWSMIVPKDVSAKLIEVYESSTDDICEKAAYAKRLLSVMPSEEQSFSLQGIKWSFIVDCLESQYQILFDSDNGQWRSTVLSLACDLYSKPLEIHNGLYHLVGWESLSKPEDFLYEEFILRVQDLSKLPDKSVDIQVLVAYLDICKYRLMNRSPKDDKRMVLKEDYDNKLEKRRIANRQFREANYERLSLERKQHYLDNKEAIRVESRLRYLANPKKYHERSRQWKKDHPDKLKEHSKRYNQKNRVAINERNKAWRAKNPEKVEEYKRRRREKRRLKQLDDASKS
ncbi:unnamed protein product [Umbelopsis vinacea]